MGKLLTKKEVFEILASRQPNKVLCIVYNRSLDSIINIKKGKYYTKFFIEYNKLLEDKAVEVAKEDPFNSNYYYYNNTLKTLEVSFKDILVTINLNNKTTNVTYNTIIRGDSITYKHFLDILRNHYL